MRVAVILPLMVVLCSCDAQVEHVRGRNALNLYLSKSCIDKGGTPVLDMDSNYKECRLLPPCK